MTRTISFIAVVGAALLVAAPGWGKGQPLATDPATEAQILRGEALDRHYGLGKFAVDPATEAQILRGEALDRHYGIGRFAVDPATEAQILRGQALDRHYGIGRFAVDPATEAQILRGQALDRHYGLGSPSTSSPDRLEPNVGARGLTDDPASRVGSTSEVSSGSEIDWAKVGVGVGIGLLLALGLVAAMRFTRVRQLGH